MLVSNIKAATINPYGQTRENDSAAYTHDNIIDLGSKAFERTIQLQKPDLLAVLLHEGFHLSSSSRNQKTSIIDDYIYEGMYEVLKSKTAPAYQIVKDFISEKFGRYCGT